MYEQTHLLKTELFHRVINPGYLFALSSRRFYVVRLFVRLPIAQKDIFNILHHSIVENTYNLGNAFFLRPVMYPAFPHKEPFKCKYFKYVNEMSVSSRLRKTESHAQK